jgi:hypothetical protein
MIKKITAYETEDGAVFTDLDSARMREGTGAILKLLRHSPHSQAGDPREPEELFRWIANNWGPLSAIMDDYRGDAD